MYNFPNNLFLQYVDEGYYLDKSYQEFKKKFIAKNYMYMIRNKTFNLKKNLSMLIGNGLENLVCRIKMVECQQAP